MAAKLRPTYRQAVTWIAHNDNAGSGDKAAQIESYLTTALVADLFGCDQSVAAHDIEHLRRALGLLAD